MNVKSILSLLLSVIVTATFGVAKAQTTQSMCSGVGLGTNGAMNGYVFAGTDAWHSDITYAAVDPMSPTILSNSADLAGAFLHPDFGSTSGIPYTVVDSSTTPGIPATLTLYAGDSDITIAPVPSDAAIEGDPGSCPTDNNDRHLIVFDRNKCVVYEYDQAGFCGGSLAADNMALWDGLSAENRPYGMTSADAAGLSIFEGLIRYDEIVAGQINHAIRFTASHTKLNANNGLFVAPASHASGNVWGTDNIIGMRLRLRPDFDISGFSPTNQIILRAMKQYGMILADNGSSLFFQGTTDPRWDDTDLSALHAIPSSAFEVLQMGTAYDASTAPTGPAPTINSFTASSSTVTSGTTVTLTADVSGASYSYVDHAGFVRNGTVTVSPTVTTTYALTSRNAYGSSTASTTITVVAAPPVSAVPTTTTTTTTTNTVTTVLAIAFTQVGASRYTITVTSNSPAPVTLKLLRGPATLTGNTLRVKGLGSITVEALQAAIPGYTGSVTLGTVPSKTK